MQIPNCSQGILNEVLKDTSWIHVLCSERTCSVLQQIFVPYRRAVSAQYLKVRPLFYQILCASGTGRKPAQQVSAPSPTCSDKLTCHDEFCLGLPEGRQRGVECHNAASLFLSGWLWFMAIWMDFSLRTWCSPSNICACIDLM